MNDFPIMQTLLLDPVPTAYAIEMTMGSYLVAPAQGVYVADSMKPAMVPGQHYYKKEMNGATAKMGNVAVMELADITGDIFDVDSRLVISQFKKASASFEPTLPIRGIAIIQAVVDNIIVDCSCWTGRQCHTSETILRDFLQPEYQEDLDVTDRITDMLVDIRSQVRTFIGHDKWIMHFKRMRGTDIIVEKTIDYRIYDWHRKHETGEWKL